MQPVRRLPIILGFMGAVLAPWAVANAEEIGCPPAIGAYRLQTSAASGTISATPLDVATASCDYRQPGAPGSVRVRAFWIDARSQRLSEDPRLRCQELAPRAAEPCTGWNCPPPVRWQTFVSDTHRAYVEWTSGSPFDEPARLALRNLLQERVVPRAAACAAGERQGGALPAQAGATTNQGAGAQAQRSPGIPGTTSSAPGPAAPATVVDITLRDMPSGPLPVGPGWLRLDGETFTIQSSPGQHTWWRLSHSAAPNLRASGVIRMQEGGDWRNAGMVLSAGERLDNMVDGAIYAGVGRDGTRLELHRWSGNGWTELGAVPSAGLRGDHVDVFRQGERYLVRLNGQPFTAPAAAGRPDWVFFLVEGGVRASITGWQVERLP
ncbi:MAG: hypothetical protein IT557_00115 [Alphaproteobacteria bacterium]|nr:hypothetical protein [Alphaproteobacteria bacterium]